MHERQLLFYFSSYIPLNKFLSLIPVHTITYKKQQNKQKKRKKKKKKTVWSWCVCVVGSRGGVVERLGVSGICRLKF